MAALTPILFFGLCLAGLGIAALGTRMLLAEHRLDRRLATRIATGPRAAPAPVFRLPAFLSLRGRDRAEVEEKLRLAGYQGAEATERFVWFRLALTAGSILAVMVLCRILWGGFLSRPHFIALVGAPAYLGSKQALRLLAARRAKAITAEFPFLLDLMLMMLQSGVSLDQCFRSIARDETIAAPHLSRQMALLVADLDRGMNYEIALDRWAARIAVNGSRELAALFRQGLFQGIELTPALREFAAEFSQRRMARARETIGTITVRMVILMILFFMPALFVVLAGPPVVAIYDTLRSVRQ